MTDDSFIIDITDEVVSDEKIYFCPICSDRFYSDHGMDSHFKVAHKTGADVSPTKSGQQSVILDDDVVIVKENPPVRRQGLGLVGSRKPLADYAKSASIATNGTREMTISAQLNDRKALQRQKFLQTKNSGSQERKPVNVVHLEEDSKPDLGKPLSGGRETDHNIALRLDRELNKDVKMTEAGASKQLDIIEDLDNYVDDQGLSVAWTDPGLNGRSSPVIPFPVVPVIKPENESKTAHPLPFTLPYDLSKTTTQRQIFSHPDSDPGQSCTFDVLRKVRTYSIEDRKAQQTELCLDIIHFASDSEDNGFSCGYRNTQMIVSAMFNVPVLRKQLMEKLGNLYIPSIFKLQTLIEQAWKNGWDPIGFKEHKGKLIGGRRWIGPVDLFALFMNLGIECKIVTFVHHHRSTGPHPALFDWIDRYFTGSSDSPVLPLYLQHEGHSQTVIGIERRNDPKEHQILVFDPAVKKLQMGRTSGNEVRWLDESVRRSMVKINKTNYELMVFTGRILGEEEQQRAKFAMRDGIVGERFVS